jgi:hypothetical protein
MSKARIVTIDTSITPPSPIFFNEKYTITPIPAKTLMSPNTPVPVEVNISGKIRRTKTVYGNASKNLFTNGLFSGNFTNNGNNLNDKVINAVIISN